MPLELSELAGGLPIAASFAMASGITALREGRRRSALNEAIHELRRPLQGLALSLPAEPESRERADGCLRMAIAALEELDREINGEEVAAPSEPVRLRPLVASALARWRPFAAASGRSLELSWAADDPALSIDPIELARALDNLINNGFVHGAGSVSADVVEGEGAVGVLIRDEGCEAPGRKRRFRPLGGDRRHGHGLRIVRRLAAGCGGSFELRHSPEATEARLELPLRRER